MAFSFKIPESLKRSPEKKLTDSPLRNSPNKSSMPLRTDDFKFGGERSATSSWGGDATRKKPDYGMFGRSKQEERTDQEDVIQKRLQLAKKTSPTDIAKRFASRSFVKTAAAKAADSIKRRNSSTNSSISSFVSPTNKRTLPANAKKRSITPKSIDKTSSSGKGEMRAASALFQVKPVKSELSEKKQEKVALLSRSEIASRLRQLVGKRCDTVYDQYQLLDERDKILCKGRVKTTDVDAAVESVGACHDMCPEKERYLREVQKRVSPYECDVEGRVVPQLTVKDYSRSAADQEEPLPHELRPGPVLMMTMDYLLSQIAADTPVNESDLPAWYDFMWNRTRAIRKDITQQLMIDENAVALIEKCTRLHIFASHRLCEFDYNEFDQKMNTENLTKCLLSLRHLYEDLAKKDISCPNEAEFRAYDVMLNLNDSNILRQVLTYPESIRQSPEVRLAVSLFTAVQNNNYVKFFRLIKERADYLQACMCHRYFYQVRSSAIKTMARSYILNGPYAVSDLTRLLCFESDQTAREFAAIFGIKCDPADPSILILNRQRFMVPESDAPFNKYQWIESMRFGHHLGQILNGGPVCTPHLPDPVVSFDSNGNYLFDPVLAPYLGSNSNEELYAGLPPPTLPPQPKPRELTTEDHKSIVAMEASVLREVIDPLVHLIAKGTFLNAVAEDQLQSMMDSLTRKAVELAFERERKETQRRKEEEIELQKHQLVEQMAQTLVDSIIQQQVQSHVSAISSREILSARLTKKRGEISELAVELRDALLSATVNELVAAKCSSVFESDVVDRRATLQSIRERLDRLWLRQFANRWLLVGARGRKRRLTLQKFPAAPLGDLTKCAEAMGRKRRRLSCPGNISSRLDRYLKWASNSDVRSFVERRRDKLASKYCAKWVSFIRKRRQQRDLFESFSSGPALDDTVGVMPTKRRRVSFPNRLSAVWERTKQSFEHSSSDRFSISSTNESTPRHIDLDVCIALSDMAEIRSGDYSDVKELTATRQSCRQSDSIVDDRLEELKANLSAEGLRIAEDRAWFDSLMLCDEF